MKNDYHRIFNAESFEEGSKAYREFVVKWKKLAAKVVLSLEEAGEELLTFYGFPKSQWKSLRITNAIERLNGEFGHFEIICYKSIVKEFFRLGYRRNEFPHTQDRNQKVSRKNRS